MQASSTLAENIVNVPVDTFRHVNIGPQHMRAIASSHSAKLPMETPMLHRVAAYIDGHRSTLSEGDIADLMNSIKGLYLDTMGMALASVTKPLPQWYNLVMMLRGTPSGEIRKLAKELQESAEGEDLQFIAAQLTPRQGYKQPWKHVKEVMGQDGDDSDSDSDDDDDDDAEEDAKEAEQESKQDATDGKTAPAGDDDDAAKKTKVDADGKAATADGDDAEAQKADA